MYRCLQKDLAGISTLALMGLHRAAGKVMDAEDRVSRKRQELISALRELERFGHLGAASSHMVAQTLCTRSFTQLNVLLIRSYSAAETSWRSILGKMNLRWQLFDNPSLSGQLAYNPTI
jgi:hypothetical protein